MAPAASSSKSKGRSNVSLLTEGSKYIQRAKKAREDQVEKVVFDDTARQEWLTGFHKRKKEKIDLRRAKAKARDHQEHLETVRKARQELKERAAENFKSVRRAMGLEDLPEDDTGAGAADDSGPRLVEQEEEFSDDEQMAVVTIVEEDSAFPSSVASTSAQATFSGDPALPGFVIPLLPASSRKQQKKAATLSAAAASLAQKKEAKRERKESDRSYETKAERRKGREIEKKKRNEKAERGMEKTRSKGRGGGRGGRGGGRGGKSGGRGGGRGGKR